MDDDPSPEGDYPSSMDDDPSIKDDDPSKEHDDASLKYAQPLAEDDDPSLEDDNLLSMNAEFLPVFEYFNGFCELPSSKVYYKSILYVRDSALLTIQETCSK